MTRECEKERKGRSRRGSSKAAGMIGAMAIAGGETMREATAQMPATSPGPPLLGAIDVYVYSAPHVFGRSANYIELDRTATKRRDD